MTKFPFRSTNILVSASWTFLKIDKNRLNLDKEGLTAKTILLSTYNNLCVSRERESKKEPLFLHNQVQRLENTCFKSIPSISHVSKLEFPRSHERKM